MTVRFERDDVSLAYDDTGEVRLPAVVFLHGLSSARTTWVHVTAALAGRYRVVRLDLRGHGGSSHAAGTYTLEHHAPDVVALLEKVVGDRAALVGHSLGGVVAAVVSRAKPELVRGAFLEDPPLYRGDLTDDDSSPYLVIFRLLHTVLTDMRARGAPLSEYEAMIAAAPVMDGRGSMLDALGRDGVTAQAKAFASLDPEVFTPTFDGTGLAGAAPDERIPCPVTVVRADAGRGAAFTAEDEARFRVTNRHANVIEITEASHMVHDEQRERFIAELVGFLDALPS